MYILESIKSDQRPNKSPMTPDDQPYDIDPRHAFTVG
jgi:hypothetical protein